MTFTAHTNAMTGNYADMKAAHLEHDEEKYNSNDTINYDLAKYNTNTIHVDDFDDWYYEEYEMPIIKYNAKQKRKDRKIENYDAYFEQKKNHGNRKNTELFSPNRLLLMGFSDKQNNDKLKSALMKKFRFTEEQYYQTMAKGMDLAVERFNEHFDNMTIVESFTHVNEGYPHTHANLYAHGTDKDGKPFTDVNDALFEHYGRFKTDDQGEVLKNKKGNNVRKSRMVLWEEFRADVDENIIHKSMLDAIEQTHGKKIRGIDFKRSGTEFVGQQHDALKEAKAAASAKVSKSLDDRAAKLDGRESDLTAREQSVDEEIEQRVNMAIKPREDAVAAREDAVADREYEVYEREQALIDDAAALAQKREANAFQSKALKEREDAAALLMQRLESESDSISERQGRLRTQSRFAEAVALGVLQGDPMRKTVYKEIEKSGITAFKPEYIKGQITSSMADANSGLRRRKVASPEHVDYIEKTRGPEL